MRLIAARGDFDEDNVFSVVEVHPEDCTCGCAELPLEDNTKEEDMSTEQKKSFVDECVEVGERTAASVFSFLGEYTGKAARYVVDAAEAVHDRTTGQLVDAFEKAYAGKPEDKTE